MPGPVAQFTRDEVLEAALELIDGGGFSMRKLGDRLGISAMTLYGYVASKDEILEGVTLLALAGIHTEPAPGAPWDEQVRSAVRELHTLCAQHPNLATLVVAGGAGAPGLFRVRERILGTLLGAGFDETTALHALGVLSYYALGFAGGQAGKTGVPATLPADEFPNLTRVTGTYGEHASDAAFEFGLEMLLTGLRR